MAQEVDGLESMKYNELWDMAKTLGIKNYGEYTGKPTKENIIEKIKLHYETSQQQKKPAIASSSNKTPRKQHAKQIIEDLSPPPAVHPRNSKRQMAAASTSATPGKLVKRRVEQHLHEALDTSEPEEKPKKKTKKSSKGLNESGKKAKKSKKKTQPEVEEVIEQPATSGAAAALTETEAPMMMPQEAKALRRKQAVTSYKIDTKAKLRNEQAPSKTKSKKEAEPVAEKTEAIAEEKLVKKKKKSKEAGGEETSKKSKNSKSSSAKETNEIEPEPVEVVEEAQASSEVEVAGKEKEKKKRTKKHARLPLPGPLARIRSEEPATNQEIPSPSTHDLVYSPDVLDNAVAIAKPLVSVVKQQQVLAKTPIAAVQQELNSTVEANANQPVAKDRQTDNLVATNVVKIVQEEAGNNDADDLSQELDLKLNEDEEDDDQDEVEQEQHNHQIYVSILTDDEAQEASMQNEEEKVNSEHQVPQQEQHNEVENQNEEIQADDANITRDIQSTTIDKSISATNSLPCTSFYKSNTEPITALVINTEVAASTSSSLPVVQSTNETKKIGAKIVRPTQKVDFVETLFKTTRNGPEEVVVKKVVEVVNREAGPRIVKPPSVVVDFNSSGKKAAAPVKQLGAKTQSKSKMPDFKAIHEKNTNKMESIVDFENRKKINKSPSVFGFKYASVASLPAATADVAPSTSGTQKILSNKTPLKKCYTSVKNLLTSGSASSNGSGKSDFDSPLRDGVNTPKMVKNSMMSNAFNKATSVITSLIPKMMINNKEPATPKNGEKGPKDTNLEAATKTPSNKPSALTNLLKSAQKSVSKNLQSIGEPPSSNNLLATSSFNRRKSYDLSRKSIDVSQTKPLNYKPHVGKVQPLDVDAKMKLFTNKLNNLNDTKVIDKSQGDKAKTSKEQKRDDKLAKKNLEANLKEKKHRKEKKETAKNQEKDKRRNLNDLENQNPVA